MQKIVINYCTTSPYKKEEWKIIADEFIVKTGRYGEKVVGELFEANFRSVKKAEPLLCDLRAVVREKAISAYQALRVPCVVEHAGLIFADLLEHAYPGGLTQPMWDALQAERFIQMKGVAGAKVLAQAHIGYCDGMDVHIFTGETWGQIAEEPRGKRGFYWDNIFCPDDAEGPTYSEIADMENGLSRKMKISQSAKAMLEFLCYRAENNPRLFA